MKSKISTNLIGSVSFVSDSHCMFNDHNNDTKIGEIVAIQSTSTTRRLCFDNKIPQTRHSNPQSEYICRFINHLYQCIEFYKLTAKNYGKGSWYVPHTT